MAYLTADQLLDVTSGYVSVEDQNSLINTLTLAGVYTTPSSEADVNILDSPAPGELVVNQAYDALLYLSDQPQAINILNDPHVDHGGILVTGAGDDTLVSYGEGNTIISAEGNDHISSNFGMSTVYGGDGVDRFDAVADGNLVYGGSGDDYFTDYDGTPVGGLQGSSFNWYGLDDTIYGGDGNDFIKSILGGAHIVGYGDAGDDTLVGAWTEDTLYGGAGNDAMWVTSGSNELHGDAGNDLLSSGNYFSEEDVDTLYGGAGADILWSKNHATHMLGYGGEGEDQLTGNSGQDTLHGDSGDDNLWISDNVGGFNLLYGDEGNDSIAAGLGDDTLYGGSGDDKLYSLHGGTSHLYGGEGDDVLTLAGGGSDTIDGGSGIDQVYFNDRVQSDVTSITFNDGTYTVTFDSGDTAVLTGVEQFAVNDQVWNVDSQGQITALLPETPDIS